MLCEWIDPLFVRYALLIIFTSTVILICSIVHFFTIFDAKLVRKPRCMSAFYIFTMCVCTGALLVFSNTLVTRLNYQTQRVEKVLSYESMTSKRELWNVLQRSYECCGRRNATDYVNGALPDSCCSGLAPPMEMSIGYMTKEMKLSHRVLYISNACSLPNAHRAGCVDALSAYMKSISRYLSLTAFSFGCIAMMGSFISCATGYGIIGSAKQVPDIRQRAYVSTA